MESLYDNIISDAGWAKIPLGILRVEGRDAQNWLHKIVTANVEHLETGQGTRSALLDAKGHFVAAFHIVRDEQIFGLFVEPSARELLFNALRRYIIREKLTVRDLTDLWTCVSVFGANAKSVVEARLKITAPSVPYHWIWGRVDETAVRVIHSIRARVPSYDVMIPEGAVGRFENALRDLPNIPEELLETLRVEAGLPRWGIDFDEATLALEIPDVMEIRVDQGCYVGQEVVARIVHRGHVNRHLRGLEIANGSLPSRGETIHFENSDVGVITSSTCSPLLGNVALGYVRREVEIGAQVQLEQASARVIELPFV